MAESPLNDAQKSAFLKEGYTGSLNDMQAQWLKFEGAVGDDLMDLWRTFFNLKGVGQGQHNERMYSWLLLESFRLPTLADTKLAYWRNRSITP